LISGDEQGNIILRTSQGDSSGYESQFNYRKRWEKKAHEGSVSSLGVFTSEQDSSISTSMATGLILSGGNDGKVKIFSWTVKEEEVTVEEVQELGLGGRMPLDLVLTTLPDSNGQYRCPRYGTGQQVC
jgi:hypothetical protein